MKKLFLCTAYVLLGIYLSFYHVDTFIIYVTVFPVMFLFLYLCIKLGYGTLSVIMILLFIGQGIGPVLMFLMKERATRQTVGNFTFYTGEYLSDFTQIFIYVVILFLTFSLLNNASSKLLHRIKNYIINWKITGKESNDKYCLLLCIFLSLLSIYMYENQIGIIGMRANVLSYHLAGILYYLRLAIVLPLTAYLYIVSRRSFFLCLSVIVCGVICSLSGSSKTLGIVLLSPILLTSTVLGEYKKAVLFAFGITFIYIIIPIERSLLFAQTEVVYSFWDIAAYALNLSNSQPTRYNIVLDFFYLISQRFNGSNVLVITSTYTQLSFDDLINYYSGTPFSKIFPNMSFLLFGFKQVAGMAFGVGIGYIGEVILLAHGEYLLIALQAVIMAVLLTIEEYSLNRIFSVYENAIFKFIMIALSIASIAGLWFGLMPIKIFYFVVITLAVMAYGKRSGINNHTCI